MTSYISSRYDVVDDVDDVNDTDDAMHRDVISDARYDFQLKEEVEISDTTITSPIT